MILALDTGLATFGWAILTERTGRVVDCGVLIGKPQAKLTKSADRVRRANDQALLLRGLAKRHEIRSVFAETMSFAPRSSAAAKIGIGLSWGVAIGIAAMLDVDLHDVPPKTWQRAIWPAAPDEPESSAIDYERVFEALSSYQADQGGGLSHLLTLSEANRTHVLDAIGVGVYAALRMVTR